MRDPLLTHALVAGLFRAFAGPDANIPRNFNPGRLVFSHIDEETGDAVYLPEPSREVLFVVRDRKAAK